MHRRIPFLLVAASVTAWIAPHAQRTRVALSDRKKGQDDDLLASTVVPELSDWVKSLGQWPRAPTTRNGDSLQELNVQSLVNATTELLDQSPPAWWPKDDRFFRKPWQALNTTTSSLLSSLLTNDDRRELLSIADVVLRQGWNGTLRNFPTVRFGQQLPDAAHYGALAGAVYEETEPRCKALGESIVAIQQTANVQWMVTDRVVANDTMIRTITVRGFDAADERVDREDLLNHICRPKPKRSNKNVVLHEGLDEVAQAVYPCVLQYMDWAAPNTKLVLNGHSIGGSLSLLLLFQLVADKGVDFVKRRVLRVYTYGSPPVAVVAKSSKLFPDECPVLHAYGLPTNLVQGFAQPWDPIVRLFTAYDPLYPLVGDMGADGVTTWPDGPPRTLRPVAKKLCETWEGWPRFRDTWRDSYSTNFTSVGQQHLLLPEPRRFLVDRFLAANIPVPPVETIVQLSPQEQLPVLTEIFPLDRFEISFVAQALRSFSHHFYPAYGAPIVDYVKDRERKKKGRESKQTEKAEESLVIAGIKDEGIDWEAATQWLQSRTDGAKGILPLGDP